METHALRGGQDKEFRDEVESTRMGMKLWNFVHKSDNKRDTRLVHTKVLKCFIHFSQDYNQKSYTKKNLIGQKSKDEED